MLHFDQSLSMFLTHIQSALSTSSQEVIILRDVYGRLSCHLLVGDESEQIEDQIKKNLNADKDGLDIYYAHPSVVTHEPDDSLWEYMQSLAQPLPPSLPEEPRVKLIERLLEGKSWLSPTQSPFDTSPPYIITFYSFKGGVGRTTAAAMSALKIARQGHRVCMIDLDLEAPGLSNVTLSNVSPQTEDNKVGVIDYLLERSLAPDQEEFPLDNYLVRLSDEIIEQKEGELWLMPAGTVDENYLVKLGRLDFQEMSAEDFSDSALKKLFLDLQEHREFDYYVVDSRTGITDIGGLALNGLADLNVMLFNMGSQNVQGMHFVLQHLRPILEKQSKMSGKMASRLMLVFCPISLGWNKKKDEEIKNKLFHIADEVIREQLSNLDKQIIPHDPFIIPYLPSLPLQDNLAEIDYVQNQANPAPYDQLAKSILDITSPSDKRTQQIQDVQISQVVSSVQEQTLPTSVEKDKVSDQKTETQKVLSVQHNLVLSTVGISLLMSHLTPEERPTHSRKLIDLANADTLTPEDESLVAEITARVEYTLASDNITLIRRKSAELNGIYALYENQIERAAKDVHILISTDTALGRLCAALVQSHLQRHGITALTYVPPGFTAANTAPFEAGIKALIYWCAETLPSYSSSGYTVVFNLAAAFSALRGYLTVIGMFYADQIAYLFEGTLRTPLLLPRLPIKIDLESLTPFAVELAMMAEGNAIVPITQLKGLSRLFYDHDERDAVISQWGLLTWQQIRDEFLGGDLLRFPRLRYEDTFRRDTGRINAMTRIRLQSALAKVATILVESNGDPSPLKSLGGVQYGTFMGKKLDNRRISHFRVSDRLRVTCIAEDGGLTLRHFGQHDYVNANP